MILYISSKFTLAPALNPDLPFRQLIGFLPNMAQFRVRASMHPDFPGERGDTTSHNIASQESVQQRHLRTWPLELSMILKPSVGAGFSHFPL